MPDADAPGTLLWVHHAPDTHTVVLVPAGDLDVALIEALRRALRVAVDGRGEVAVDLSHVSTADSMALGVLVSAHRQLRRRGLAVTEVAPRIGAVLQVTGLSKLLVVLPAATQPPAASAGQVRPGRRACGLPGP